MEWSDKSRSGFRSMLSFEGKYIAYNKIHQAYREGYINKKNYYKAYNKVIDYSKRKNYADRFYRYKKNDIQPVKILHNLCAGYFEMDPDELVNIYEKRKIGSEFHITVYLCTVLTDCSITKISQYFNIDKDWIIDNKNMISNARGKNIKLENELWLLEAVARDYHVCKRI